MTDWADEIADRLQKQIESSHDCGYFIRMDGVAAALRKAKADGMREAHDIFYNEEHWGDSTLALVRDAASKLDPPTS